MQSSDTLPALAIIMAFDHEYARSGLGARSQLNKQHYAERHNYSLLVETQPVALDRRAAWAKVLVAARHLADFDWLFYVDTDTIITNPDIRLEV